MITVGENFAAIIEKILSLRSTEDTIIRTQTLQNQYVNTLKERGDFDEKKVMLDRWNQQILDIAARYGVPVADVYHELNGPNGDQDLGDQGYIASDGEHLNDKGHLRVAESIRELGYAPLAR